MKKSGMSFVEVLIVVTIIMLVSASGFVYLSRMLGSGELSTEVQTFGVFLDNLYQDVKLKNRLSYEVTISQSIGFTYILDANSDKYAYFSTSDFTTGNFTLASVGTNAESWALDVYSNDKKKSSELYSSTFTPVVTLKTAKETLYKSYFSGEFSNELGVSYFSSDNLKTNQDRYTKITAINAKEDKTGTTYTSIKIVNKNGNKKLYSGTTQLTAGVYLFFEKGDQMQTLYITP